MKVDLLPELLEAVRSGRADLLEAAESRLQQHHSAGATILNLNSLHALVSGAHDFYAGFLNPENQAYGTKRPLPAEPRSFLLDA